MEVEISHRSSSSFGWYGSCECFSKHGGEKEELNYAVENPSKILEHILTMFSFSNLAVPLAFFLRLVQAAFSPITDCDEVFNYWEPLIYIIGYTPKLLIKSFA